MTVNLISSGNYSDYSMVGVLTAEAGKDLHALYAQFKVDTGKPVEPPRPHNRDRAIMDAYAAWRVARRDWYENLEKQWGYADGYCNEAQLFSHWLITTQGFVDEVYEELNLGYD